MVVICISKSIHLNNKFAINTDLNDYLEIDKLYNVYGIRLSNEMIYYTIFNDNHLIEVPNQLFEIKDQKVYPHWEIKLWGNNDFTFWPTLFYKDNFFENFSDWEEVERNEFHKLKLLFED